MALTWRIEPHHIEQVRRLVERGRDNPLVKYRVETNIEGHRPEVTRDRFWHLMIFCLLTTQQRSGPDSAVQRFRRTSPFLLGYELCLLQDDVELFVRRTLQDFGGIRYFNRIAGYAVRNLWALEHGLWQDTFRVIEALGCAGIASAERDAAHFIDRSFVGFGPKQARNLLQLLGLTKYEIPIDSRVVKWLNGQGLSVELGELTQWRFYDSVSDNLQRLCKDAGVYPCILDAAIFASFDREA